MVIVEVGKDKWAMDGYLHQNLLVAKELLEKDWDMPFVVDGVEGGGKSVLAMQCCKFMDETFDLDRICWKPEEFLEKIANAKNKTALMYDEAYGGLSSRGSMTETNRVIVSTLAEIRQKNLFVIFVLPTFFDLDRNIALWRTRALIHVYTDDKLQRGRFMFFNYKKKITLFQMGKKFYDYRKPPADFIGRFTNKYVVNEDEYRTRKHKALIESAKYKKTYKGEVWARHYGTLLRYLYFDLKYTAKQISEISKSPIETIRDHLKKISRKSELWGGG